MPDIFAHGKKCKLCHRVFGSAKRHFILGARRENSEFKLNWYASSSYDNYYFPICGRCKDRYNTGHVARYVEYCTRVYGRTLGYFHVPFYVKPTKLSGRKKRIRSHNSRRFQRNKKWDWAKAHNDTVRILKNPAKLKELHRFWTPKEKSIFADLLRIEREQKKEEEARLMEDMEQEYCAIPLNEWLNAK